MIMEVLSEVGVQSRFGFLNDHFNINRRKSLYSRIEVMGRETNREGKKSLERKKLRES